MKKEVRELLWSKEEFRPLYCWISRTFLTPIGWAITKNQWYFIEDVKARDPLTVSARTQVPELESPIT